MKFEDITAPPPRLSPEMRYASLHRTIENGLATDRTWAELLEVCLHVERSDEACTALGHIKELGLRRRMLARLHSRGLMREVSLDPAHRAERGVAEPRATSLPTRVTHADLVDLLGDSVRFLFLDHMPLTVIVATVTFPLVVGVGGLVTTGATGATAYFLLSLVALIPALTAIGLIGALGRQVILDGYRGLVDPPHVPGAATLARDALRFLGDGLALGAVLLAPGIGLFATGLTGPLAAALVLLGGIAVLPLAMALRQVRDDWRCLDPRLLARTITAIGPVYPALAGISALAFAPAAIGITLTSGSALYLSLCVAGPLLVAPMFIVARLVGLVLNQTERRARRLAPAVPSEPQPEPAPRRGSNRITKIRLRDGSRAHPELGPVPAALAAPTENPLAAPIASVAAPTPPAAPAPAAPPVLGRPLAPDVRERIAAAAQREAAPTVRGPRVLRDAPSEAQRAPAADRRDRAAPPAAGARPTAARPTPRGADAGRSAAARSAAVARRPAPGTAPEPRPVAGDRPSRRLRTRAESDGDSGVRPGSARPSPRPGADAVPDLASLPGARVLRGAARVNAGAAARRR